MGYLYKLIERATDTTLDLENNQIGNYRITPQHGNVAVYHIFKNNVKPHYSKTTKRYNDIYVCTITIDFNRVDIDVNSDYLKPFEISQIQDVINNLYSTFDINIKNF